MKVNGFKVGGRTYKAKKKGMRMHKEVTLSGHLESWVKGTSKNPKIMFVADYVLEVA